MCLLLFQFELVCDLDYVSDTITSVQMAGVLVGSILFGQLSDSFGRKKVKLWVILLFINFGWVIHSVSNKICLNQMHVYQGFGK